MEVKKLVKQIVYRATKHQTGIRSKKTKKLNGVFEGRDNG